jgi:hypothetical protein
MSRKIPSRATFVKVDWKPAVGRENSIITEGWNTVAARMLSSPAVGSSEIVHLPRRDRLMDWSNSDGETGSLQAAREYSLMRPWSRCLRTITPPSGIG